MTRRPPVKRIRTNHVREDLRGLTAARDAGLSLGPRQRRTRKSPYPALTIAVSLLGLALIGWMLSWESAPSENAAFPEASAVAVADEPEREPTPRFAHEGPTRIHLAVDPAQLTALAFHQAAGRNALPMTSLVPDADMALAAQIKGVPQAEASEGLPEDVWGGVCLRMWRSNRGGMPDTAVDMGGEPGTPVWSPVTGTVVAVKPYLLYDQHDDVELHIRPEGREDIDVVLIHITDVLVEPGDRVLGGVTRIASIRKMSDKIEVQLGGYTTNGGDHVHMQLNLIQASGELAPAGGS